MIKKSISRSEEISGTPRSYGHTSAARMMFRRVAHPHVRAARGVESESPPPFLCGPPNSNACEGRTIIEMNVGSSSGFQNGSVGTMGGGTGNGNNMSSNNSGGNNSNNGANQMRVFESLCDAMFSPRSSPQEKAHAGKQIVKIKSTGRQFIPSAMFVLQKSNNMNAIMMVGNILLDIVTKSWNKFSGQEKMQMSTSFFLCVLSHLSHYSRRLTRAYLLCTHSNTFGRELCHTGHSRTGSSTHSRGADESHSARVSYNEEGMVRGFQTC